MIGIFYTALGYFVTFLRIIIWVRCLLSWIPALRFNYSIVIFISRLTDPMLMPIRNMVYRSPLGGPGMMIDISPVILLLLIEGGYGMIGQMLGAML